MRERASGVLQAAALVTAFLGGLGLRGDDTPLSGWTVAAAVVFSLLATLVVYILKPRRTAFSVDPHVLIRDWDLSKGHDYVVTSLAEYYGDFYDENRRVLRLLPWCYMVILLLLVLLVLVLLIDLGGRMW